MRQAAAIRYRLSVVSELERRLREWGLAYGAWPLPDPGDEPEQARETALSRTVVDRTRENDIRGEDGWRPAPRINVTRRRIRQQVGDTCRVPAWAGGDPMRAPRSYGGNSPLPEPPEEAQAVEGVVLVLFRWDQRAALALRARYCLLGRRPLSERIAWCVERGSGMLTRHGFRGAEARGRLWVKGELKLEA